MREAYRGGDGGRLAAVGILVLAAFLLAWTRIDGVDSSYGLTFLAMALLLIAADPTILKGGTWNWAARVSVRSRAPCWGN